MPVAFPVQLPARLTRKDGQLVPKTEGADDAGWTVIDFETIPERDAFMDQNPAAAMPCWPRIIRGTLLLRR